MTQQIITALLAGALCGPAFAPSAFAQSAPAGASPLIGPYRLTVDLSSIPRVSGKLYLTYHNLVTGTSFADSLPIDGHAPLVFTGNLAEPILAELRLVPKSKTPALSRALGYAPRNLLSVYLQPGEIRVAAEDSLSNSVVTGSPAQADYLVLKWSLDPYNRIIGVLNGRFLSARATGDTVGLRALEKLEESTEEAIRNKVYKAYFLKHASSSPVAVFALVQYANIYNIQPDEVEPLLGKLAPAYLLLPTVTELKEKVAIARRLSIGAIAPDFTQTDTLGTPVSLSSFKGKYVLVDFWGSWCWPCRSENPHLVEAYRKYKDRNFTILGVSLERPEDREKWLRAIHEDNLTWTQVSDLRFWDNPVAKTYGVEAIPQNILIDPQGKIVAKNLRGAGLEQKLQEIIGKTVN